MILYTPYSYYACWFRRSTHAPRLWCGAECWRWCWLKSCLHLPWPWVCLRGSWQESKDRSAAQHCVPMCTPPLPGKVKHTAFFRAAYCVYGYLYASKLGSSQGPPCLRKFWRVPSAGAGVVTGRVSHPACSPVAAHVVWGEGMGVWWSRWDCPVPAGLSAGEHTWAHLHH